MRKSLVRRVSEGIGLIGALGIMALAGCKFPGPNPNPTPDPPSPPTPPISQTVTISGEIENLDHQIPSQIPAEFGYQGYKGVIRAYQPSDSLYNNPIKDINKNDTFYTDSNGKFSFQIDPNSDLSGIVLRAEIVDVNGDPTTYVRTIDNLPKGNITSSSDSRMNPAIRVVPYIDINGDGQIGSFNDINGNSVSEIDGFIDHLEEIFTGTDNDGFILKNNIQNVDILSTNFAGRGSFSSTSTPPTPASVIEPVIEGLSNVILGGRINPYTGQNSIIGNVSGRSGLTSYIDNTKVYGNPNSPNTISPPYSGTPPIVSTGYYIIMPDDNSISDLYGGVGFTTVETQKQNPSPLDIIDNAISFISVDPTNWGFFPENFSHEALRALIGTQSESITTLGQYTVLNTKSSSIPIYSYASNGDQAVVKISHEETYPTGTLISKVAGKVF
jgi:hypothetical protein